MAKKGGSDFSGRLTVSHIGVEVDVTRVIDDGGNFH